MILDSNICFVQFIRHAHIVPYIMMIQVMCFCSLFDYHCYGCGLYDYMYHTINYLDIIMTMYIGAEFRPTPIT
ncbi:hypothetical protein ACN38_g11711 [Penicillium nordicum]|uniref:Uncharacterized protein n=1 Tax=Penicillium nordicum TaxID=229535 RepID=A0A0M9WAH4_9EURO|nr:hypothetical protein ACN38_g11711 [Penicillium nordicum]